MRPVSVFAKGPGSEIEQLRAQLRGRWRQAARAVMVLLSLHGLPPSQIAKLLDCHPATVRCWISGFNSEGLAGRTRVLTQTKIRTLSVTPTVPNYAAQQ
jgi:hypothetical protein